VRWSTPFRADAVDQRTTDQTHRSGLNGSRVGWDRSGEACRRLGATMLRTRLTDLFQIRVPVVLAPFGPWDQTHLAVEARSAAWGRRPGARPPPMSPIA
jgi:hypothetical protein